MAGPAAGGMERHLRHAAHVDADRRQSPLELSPHINHWWEVPLYVSARGLTTSPIPCPGGIFEVQFDFIDHKLEIVTSWNESKTIRLYTRTVAGFYREFMDALHVARDRSEDLADARGSAESDSVRSGRDSRALRSRPTRTGSGGFS